MRAHRLSTSDMLDMAECQLRMVKERNGRITGEDVRTAAADWSIGTRQAHMLRNVLADLIS